MSKDLTKEKTNQISFPQFKFFILCKEVGLPSLSEPPVSSIPLIYVEQLSPTYTHTNTNMVTLISLHHTKINAVYLVFRAS